MNDFCFVPCVSLGFCSEDYSGVARYLQQNDSGNIVTVELFANGNEYGMTRIR